MKPRNISDRVQWMGAIDWNRRLFDSLIPLPDGTSYNVYFVQGSEKTALIDTVDPAKVDILLEQLKDIPHIDYLISHHAEQDHSGSIPVILEKYPEAKLVCSQKAKELLIDHLCVAEDTLRQNWSVHRKPKSCSSITYALPKKESKSLKMAKPYHWETAT